MPWGEFARKSVQAQESPSLPQHLDAIPYFFATHYLVLCKTRRVNRLYYVIRLAGESRAPQGPLKMNAVLDLLKGGLLAWTDIAWTPHLKSPWLRLYEFPEFQEILPKFSPADQLESFIRATQAQPAAEPGHTQPTAATTTDHLRPPFYLHVVGAERGPFTLFEVKELLNKAKFTEQVYLWCKGLRFWVPIQEIPGFEDYQFAASKMTRLKNDVFEKAARGQEGRASHREGLVSTVRATAWFGVCLDVSATGMQVRIENHVDLKKGDLIQLEMIPLSLLKLPNFNAQIKVAWYKPDQLCLGAEFVSFERGGWERLKTYLSR
jgi:hypothetical protein